MAARMEIASGRLASRRRVERQLPLRLSIRLIDELLEELEGLNLARRRYVPSYVQPFLARLQALGEVETELMRPRMRVRTLMDRLYDAQEELLRRKGGAYRDALQKGDDPPDAA